MTICLYCGRPSTATIPPMCDKHIDLILLINYLGRNGRVVNADNIRALLKTGLPLGLTADEVDDFLASYLAVETKRTAS